MSVASNQIWHFFDYVLCVCVCVCIIGSMEVKGGSKAGVSQENGEMEEDVFNHDP